MKKTDNKELKINQCFKIIGNNITLYRKKNKLTLEDLGIAIGLDKSSMHHIENGKPITLRTFLKISAVLSVKPTLLLTNIPDLNPEDID